MLFRDLVRPFASSSTLKQVALLALVMGAYSCLAMWKEFSPYGEFADMPSGIHAAFSLVLGALLVFRTNTAYARWWEARTLWGGLVNASRNLAIKVTTLTQLAESELTKVRGLMVAFPVALRNHLRDEVASIEQIDDEIRALKWDHLPAGITREIYNIISRGYADRKLDGDVLRVIDHDLSKLMDICGGCERIHRTRIVGSYRTFARQCVLLFLLTVPWGIAHDFGWWTVPITIMTSYFMLGLEIVAEHVEEPFGLDEDDLDLDILCVKIRQSIEEIFNRACTV
jgi:ion channel-forming bestrophin family protein